jgi:hypothetical protein
LINARFESYGLTNNLKSFKGMIFKGSYSIEPYLPLLIV